MSRCVKHSILFLLVLLVFGVQAGVAQGQDKAITTSIGMEMVLIPAGSFDMGCNPDFENCYSDERPQHRATLSKPFYLGKYPVTQAQWVAVMGNNPSKFKGRDNPVEEVSWDDAQTFIRRLNEKEGHSRYRLPTEAEWEYAARAGTTGAYFFGDDGDELSRYGWYRDNSGKKTRPVGQKQPNAWGLYDVHGNVYEWVQDWKGDYSSDAVTDPKGPSSGSVRVHRGGSWLGPAEFCRSAHRSSGSPDFRNADIGFRLALSPGQ